MKPCIVKRLKSHFTREADVAVEGGVEILVSLTFVCMCVSVCVCLFVHTCVLGVSMCIYHYMLAMVLLHSVTEHCGKHTIQ